jgi:hypothetical protein
VLYLGHVFPGQYGFELYNEEQVRYFLAKLDRRPTEARAWVAFSPNYLPLEAVSVLSSKLLVEKGEIKTESNKEERQLPCPCTTRKNGGGWQNRESVPLSRKKSK